MPIRYYMNHSSVLVEEKRGSNYSEEVNYDEVSHFEIIINDKLGPTIEVSKIRSYIERMKNIDFDKAEHLELSLHAVLTNPLLVQSYEHLCNSLRQLSIASSVLSGIYKFFDRNEEVRGETIALELEEQLGTLDNDEEGYYCAVNVIKSVGIEEIAVGTEEIGLSELNWT